ncbi:MAG: type IVB secretion system protein IcmH/DotU [Chromatiaceae bacterium]|jgi:type VI secretion system protein ImpK|nr:type IVB secretion system protein IcmH/DotU [Chromatiaceae bacterium]
MSDQDKTRISYGTGDSQTLIRPRPGFRPDQDAERSFGDRRSAPPEAPAARPRPETGATASSSWNPLVEAASPLFFRATQIRNTATNDDIYGLRARFVNDLTELDQRSRSSGEPTELLADARYALCTFVDETVLNTPWGSQSKWQEESLLSTFFNETWGGDRFFAILDRAKQQPGRNLALLELLFVCLVLGFEGKYHVLERGRARLEEVIDDLYRTLRAQRSDLDRELSPRWRGVDTGSNNVSSYLPLWVLGAIAAALLVSLYLAFRFALSGAAYPVFEKLSGLGREQLDVIPSEGAVATKLDVVAKPPVSKLRLPDILGPEIEQDLLSVEQEGLKSLIRIKSDTLFRSGSATVEARFIPILERIGKATDQVSGRILVIGHSDNVPINTIQFPSNWELSRARAVNVMKELGKHVRDPKRMTPEGRADTEPVAPNDTPANRALNRRVEIFVFEQEEL